MNFSNVRLDTFEQDFVLKKPTKSKVKFTELKQKLTDIGFYHSKNGFTTCFVCGFTAGNWELNSDPLKVQHSNCYWFDLIKNAKSKSFSNQENYSLRLETYKNGWVGRGSIDKKEMANAGFHYDPCQDQLDRVSCGVCNLVLEGWEDGDDPLKEHEIRRPSCAYIKFILDQKCTNNIPKKELELLIHNLATFPNTFTSQERLMTVEEFIKYQQEKAKEHFVSESNRILENLISQGHSLF